MLSGAKLSTKSKRVPNLELRMKRLEKYEKWGDPVRIGFQALVGKELWEKHWDNWEKILTFMQNAQEVAEKVRYKVAREYKKYKSDASPFPIT
jgi:hypothetical protein